ncbi:MAG: hypothetical protein COW04_04235 [Deltaproteobacteria bacterium CG12_big_fil_rev_8_21_14_0_65_43_10]|nr:MAG: hypothetical protein AUK23_08985 [Deltaproteobacteria bacterium CG2_30_43_15]PIQ46065.1 MAG: hypothetical protein COW04_04235 [Deltaproteobacteria bacterium CG12_big_fil_rev_8_21_14_0_65_43_10]PIU85674.1 MAG: hypothetical protein COS67_06670 [Deltaproteobacteria bacterium CG06_land_8_20_14_3_00_44_19]PIX26784.1 MAG: hypothetical protein COZ68_00025 [Deltaproteobacteria bacterium CG_4_8_14_3_um_filter_43_13]PIZ18993.1 MAG: hypothetical protein COY50_12445 [Deltaproteobacteria bacterium C
MTANLITLALNPADGGGGPVDRMSRVRSEARMSYTDKKAVLSFETEDIYHVKRILLDSDVKGAMEFLKKLEKRLDEAMNPK